MRCGTNRILFRLAGEAILLAVLLCGPVAAADDTVAVTIRSGNHPDFGRIVFDAPPRLTYHVTREGDHVTVQFTGDVALNGDPALPRNVSALHADHGQAELTIAAGATFHAARVGEHVVIDVFDPTAAPSAPPPATGAAAASSESKPPAPAANSAPSVSRPTTAAARPATTGTPAAAASKPAPTGTKPPSTAVKPWIVGAGAPSATSASATRSSFTRSSFTLASATLTSATPASATPASATPASATPASATRAPVTRAPAVPATAPVANSEPTPPPGSTAPQPVTAVTKPAPAATQFQRIAAPAPPSSDTATPVALADANTVVASALLLPPDTKGSAFSLPFPGDVGAAVFSRHGETLVAFDNRRRLDLTAMLSDAAFTKAWSELLPAGTLLHLTPPPGMGITVSRTAQGWTISALPNPPQPRPFITAADTALLNVSARNPGGVLAIPDPLTGGTLLIGTQRQPGQAILALRRMPQFTLLPTTQGVVIAPLADTVVLRVVPNGFAVTTAPDPLAVSRSDAGSFGDAAALTRRFAFSNLPTKELVHQLSAEIAAAGAEPVLARGPRRRAAATTMIALGMGAEAEALLQLTAADDPRLAGSADVTGLTAVAAMLAGRPTEATGIEDPRLTGTDEIVLWRALHAAMLDDASPVAAGALANTAPLLLSYPPPIRDRMLPLAAETMVRGGADAAARTLLAHATDVPGLGMARAMLAETIGDNDAALAHYDALAAGRDQYASSRAAVRAVKLRLATGKLDTRQAAEALDRLLYDWRGDQRELALREELADMRQKLGDWRAALALLRDSEAAFPDEATTIHARLQATFDALLREDAADKLPPLEFVALVDENADLVPATPEGAAIRGMLADQLLALDLPDRAAPVLDKLMRAAPPGPGRAEFGTRLAKLRLGQADAAGALATLAASDAADLPAPLVEQRALLRAGAQARQGDTAGAISALSGIDTPAAEEIRVGILEQAKDWPGAEHALTDYVAKTVPPTGELDDGARRLLLRLATAAARAGDDQTLAALRDQQEARMGAGPVADMFRLLTADPVHGVADLARVGREAGYVRALPANLQAMRP